MQPIAPKQMKNTPAWSAVLYRALADSITQPMPETCAISARDTKATLLATATTHSQQQAMQIKDLREQRAFLLALLTGLTMLLLT